MNSTTPQTYAQKKAAPEQWNGIQKQSRNDAPAPTQAQPKISQKLALEILKHQAAELQAIAREIIQQGYVTTDLSLLQRAAAVIYVTGKLGEALGGAHHGN